MQFSKFLYKEPFALEKIFKCSQKFGAVFFSYSINNGCLAQKRSPAGLYERPEHWRLLGAFEIEPLACAT